MTKQTAVVDVSSFTTDAKFRTWGLAMSTALQATPLVKTSDTGQINWTTVTKPVAINTKAGYEIYRFSDTLQATKPVFLRVDYGSMNVTSGNGPGTWLTVGTGSDGAGTITGPVIGPIASYSNSSATISNTAMTGYFTHTSNGYALLHFGRELAAANTTSNAGWFTVARTVNRTTGAATGDGVVMIGWTLDTAWTSAQRGINFNTGTAYTTGRYPGCNVPAEGYSMATATTVPLGKLYASVGDIFASDQALCHYSADITAMSTFSASPFGMAHTYIAWGAQASFFNAGNGAVQNVFGASIWED